MFAVNAANPFAEFNGFRQEVGEPFFKSLAAFTDKRGITVNLTFSGDPAAFPDFMRAYIAG